MLFRSTATNASGRDEGPKGLRGRQRQGSNFLSSMLHPGPSMPPRHRPSMTKRESSSGEGAGGSGGGGGGGGGEGDVASVPEPVTRSNTHVPQPSRREHGTIRPIRKRMSV